MTATLPATASAPAARRAHRTPVPGGGVRNRPRRALNTPTALRALLVTLVLLSLTWGVLGGWVAARHSSAADSLVSTDERLSLQARQMFQSIGDADATITAAFLASPRPPLSQLQRYQADLAAAHRDLSGLQAAGGGPVTSGALARLGGGLSAYSGYVGEATAEYAMGYPLTGGSFLQVASEEAHLVLLPAANTVFTQENDALNAASGQAAGLPTMLAAIAVALVTAFVLYRAQRWLTGRTNRVLSPGLVIASLLLAISVIWLAAGFLAARGDLDGGIAHGSGPVQNLALASIDVQQIRGDAVLNVISRSGSTSFQTDFGATSKRIGPGDGSLLGAAAAAQQDSGGQGGHGAALVANAERDATAWYAANTQVYQLGAAANYAAERDLVVGAAAGSTATGYTLLEGDITRAIAADQGIFDSAATAGANSLDPLAGVVVAAAAAMALCCGWAVSRRLAEYR
jgi:hypothetical protein